jgi:hypothetical protein
MKKMLLLFCLACASIVCFSQKEAWSKFEKERLNITKRSMMVLAGWSVANLVVSGAGTGTHNTEMRYFHQMNVMWGGINLALSGLGYWGANKEKVNNPTLLTVLQHQNRIEKTYLYNNGLDIAYMAGGLYMKERSKSRKDPAKLKGYGNSIIMQGAFLFLYDAVIYSIHRKHGKQLERLVDKLQLNAGPGSVSLVYHL